MNKIENFVLFIEILHLDSSVTRLSIQELQTDQSNRYLMTDHIQLSANECRPTHQESISTSSLY